MMMVKALEVLQKYFGYTEFRDGQQKVIESILLGSDTLAIMPTGAGKSLAYQIPALLLKGTTLVISPLISLMKDQVDALQQYGIAATFINSSLSLAEAQLRIKRAADGEYKLLYVAPERLESESFRVLLKSLSVSFIAIDEAHCVSQWGHDFRPSYLQLGSFVKSLPKKPLIGAFTATATEAVQSDIVSMLELKQPKIFVTGFDRPNLTFSAFRGENKRVFVLDYLQTHSDQSGIIYAGTRKEVDSLQQFLVKKGIRAGKYHAGMNDQDRQKSQEDFLFDEQTVMVATNAFGMGIDKSNVRYVIHYNMPRNMEAYYQEAGRAGRDGDPAECLLLYSPQDRELQKYLIEQTFIREQDVNETQSERKLNELKKLKGMVEYCHTPRCLRKTILEYFNEVNVQEQCGNCGNCNDDRELIDITVDAQKIFSCIYRMRERFGIGLVAEVLKGSRKAKILELRFDELSTHGIMSKVSLQELKDRINYLVAENYLELSDGEYPVVKLLPAARSVLKGEAKVTQRLLRKTTREKEKAINLFDFLRALRKKIAHEENRPPYMIFTDVTLREMAQACPVDKHTLILISGVGERKLEKYGEQFLEEIRAFIGENQTAKIAGSQATEPLEVQITSPLSKELVDFKKITNAPKGARGKVSSHLQTFQLYQEGHSLRDIANLRDVTMITVQNHLVRCFQEGHAVPWDDFIPTDQEVPILEAIRQVGKERLRPIKDLLSDEVEWFAIRAVIEKHKL